MSMMSKNDLRIKKIISKIKKISKNCKTVEDYVEAAYSFQYEDFTIVPLQKRGEIFTLLKILKKFKPKNLLEIGTAGGGTLFLLSSISDPNATILSIDLPGGPFKGELYPDWKMPIYESFVTRNQKIHLIRADSHDKETLKKVKRILGAKKLDFILIDGDHTFRGVKRDFDMYRSLVKKGGIIAFHDIVDGLKEEVGGVPKYWKKIKLKNTITEIVDNFGERCCGIGLNLVATKKNSPKHNEIEKILTNVKSQRIVQLYNKIENLKPEILIDPISHLMSLYNDRIDLQQTYPEASKGNLIGLVEWAKKILNTKNKDELNSKIFLSKHSKWYSQYLSNFHKQQGKLNKEKSHVTKILSNYKKSVDSLQQENTDYKKSILPLQEEISNYKKSVDSFQQENTDYKKSILPLQEEISNYKKSVDSLQQENANYKKSILPLQEEISNYKKSILPLQEEISNYKKSVDSLQQENANYKKSILPLQEEISNYKKSVDSLQQENSNLTMKVDEYKNNIDDRHKERENLLNEITKFKEIVKTFQQEQDGLIKELDKYKNAEASLKFQLSETKKELDDIKYSKSFKAVRSVTSKIEKIRKKKQILNDIKATVSASRKTIENEGVGSFLSHAKQRLKSRELLLQSKTHETTPIKLSTKNGQSTKTNYATDQKIIEKKFNVTVVIPTNSHENSLLYLIDNIKLQKGLKTLQIILVNSGTNDLKNLEKFPEVTTINIKPEEFGHGKSRNLGFEESKGDYVFFTTDDAIPVSNHLFYDMCETFYKDKRIAVVTGRQFPRSDSDLMSIFSLYEYYEFLNLNEDRIITTSNFDKLDSYEKRRTSQIDDVCSCYKREIFSKYKFGNVKYAEDLEMGIRLVKDGYKIAQLYSTGVIHSHIRPASYYLRRGFVETKVFTSFFGDHFVDFEKFQIHNIQDIFDHIISLYNSLNHVIDMLKQKKTEEISDAFSILKTEIPKFYSPNSKATSVDNSLQIIFKDFSSNHNYVKNENFLLDDYLHSLSALKTFLTQTYPNLLGIEDEFFETLYKKFGVLVGNRLGALVLFAEKQKLKDKNFEQLEKILTSGV